MFMHTTNVDVDFSPPRRQLFAQVTNPPIDPFREKIVMSLACPIGPMGNVLEPDIKTCQRLWLDQPILSLGDMEIIKVTSLNGWKAKVIDITYDITNGALELEDAIDMVCVEAQQAAKQYQFLVLSDRNIGQDRVPISAILIAGAVHHHLINKRLRSKCAIILETGEIREVHQICVAIGYGVDAICPYMVFELAQMLRSQNIISQDMTDDMAYNNYVAAVDRGISKVNQSRCCQCGR
jgi:glutamate synthase (NADPH/NADH)